MTGRIALEGLEFHAFHGVYPHERESGNWFVVDIAVDTDITRAALHDELSETVNYEILFRIVKEAMDKPSKLLETVAYNIITTVLEELPSTNTVDLKIAKVNPPIGGKLKEASLHIIHNRTL